MAKSKYSYILSPVAYNEDTGKEEDRASEPIRFSSREEVDDFIDDMGSRWVMYPNLEIYKVPGDGKSFSWKNAKFVVGYSEDGEYGAAPQADRATSTKHKKPATRKRARKSSQMSLGGMR